MLQDLFIEAIHEAREKRITADPNLAVDEGQDLSEGLRNPIEDDDDELGSLENLGGKGADPSSQKRAEFPVEGEAAVASPILSLETIMSQLVSDISSMTFAVTEMLVNKSVKFLSTRQGQNARLSVKDFFWLNTRVSHLIKLLELNCNRSHYNLKTALLSQVISFYFPLK